MTGTEAIDYIHSKGWMGSRPGLSRVGELLERMNNPQNRLKFIHIAGTNGKGSTSAMLAEILRCSGYKTGLYTSPFIHCFEERIQVNSCHISGEELGSVTAFVREHAEQMAESPTEFELLAAVAFEHFARSGCHLVVLETGLGGRLDATNIIPAPEVAVITTIGLDHTQQLGNTVEAIAGEKAGIIKPGCDVVLYPQSPSVTAVFSAVCHEVGATLHHVAPGVAPTHSSLTGQRFDYGSYKNLELPLLGDYQTQNAAVVLETMAVLNRLGWSISEDAIRQGLAGVRWPGRFEVLQKSPPFVVDGGHNPEGARSAMANLARYFPGRQMILLTGVLADKDYPELYDAVAPHAREIFTLTPVSPRALEAQELSLWLANRYHKPTQSCPTVQNGVKAALNAAGPEDVVLALGSLYLVGPIRDCFGADKK